MDKAKITITGDGRREKRIFLNDERTGPTSAFVLMIWQRNDARPFLPLEIEDQLPVGASLNLNLGISLIALNLA